MWLSNDWAYRKKITIAGETGAGTDYQVLLKIGETSGATGEDFDLEGNSLIFPATKNDGGDLRFTSDDGTTLLDFWVEKVEGTTPNALAYVWVEVADSLETTQDIYCYYTNAGASNYSNGDDTFPFFDDFEGSSLDSSKWDTIGTPTLTVSSSILKIQLTSEIAKIESKTYTRTRPVALRFREKKYNVGSNYPLDIGFGTYDATSNNNCVVKASYGVNEFTLVSGDNTSNEFWTGIADDINFNDWEVRWTSAFTRLYKNEAQQNGDLTTYIPSTSQKIRLGKDYSSTNESDIDFIFSRKFIATEPSFSSASAQEDSTIIVILEDTVTLSETTQPLEFVGEETTALSDSIITDIAHYATKIRQLDATNMLVVTDTDPAKIIKIDISGGAPVFRIHTLLTAKNATDVTVNSTFNKIYVSCKDGLAVKLDSTDLTVKTLLDTGDTDDLTNIDCLDDWLYTYASTDDSSGEIILIDESEITKLNSDIRFLIQAVTTVNSQISTIFAAQLNSNLIFLRTSENIVNSDIRFSKYTYGAETILSRPDFHVYINGVQTGDVSLDSIRISESDETKSLAYFSVARKHDDLDRTLAAVASEITNKNPIIIKIEDRIVFTGTIREIQCSSSETVTITAESASVGTVDFNTVDLGLQTLNTQIHLYDVLVDDINLFNPTIGAEEENPVKYKGISVDLGDSIRQYVVKWGSIGKTPATSSLRRLYDRNLATEVNAGTFKPESDYTYFWWVNGWKKNPAGYWNLLRYKNAQSVFSIDYQNSWAVSGQAFYIGTSLVSSSSGIYHFDFIRQVKQRVFNEITTPLGTYTLGDAPFKEISVRNGKSYYNSRYEDDDFYGLIVDRPEGHNHVDYAKEIAAIEFDKMKTINDEILPVTRVNITLTIDAFLYYSIKLNTRINLDNTTVTGTYKNTNGFPVSVKGIEIDSNNMRVRLICDNTKSKNELDALDDTMPNEYNIKYYIPHLIVPVNRKFNLDTEDFDTGSISVLQVFQNSEYYDYSVEGSGLVRYPDNVT